MDEVRRSGGNTYRCCGAAAAGKRAPGPFTEKAADIVDLGEESVCRIAVHPAPQPELGDKVTFKDRHFVLVHKLVAHQ